jgi:hypothetical protein
MKQYQAQQQMAQRTQEIQNQLVEAQIIERKGLGAERFSRIQENQMLAQERRAEAINDLNLATLHEVEAVKALTEMDLSNFEKFIGIVQMLKGQKEQEKEVIKANESPTQGQNV